MLELSDVTDLVSKIDEALACRPSNPALANQILDNLIYIFPPSFVARALSLDPLGDSYRYEQRSFFEKVAGKSHSLADEGHDTVGVNIKNAFPFYMHPKDVGYWIVIYGHLVQKLNLDKGSKILEIGFGPGGLTEVLVRTGLDVTAIDCNSSNCEFIQARVAAFGGKVTALVADANTFHSNDRFDAIVFFESFHHMWDFDAMLKNLKLLLKPNGFFLFGAEPIVPENHPHVPLPWCIRTPGQALCALREVGWVELGFQEGFFRRLMSDLGFGCEKSFLLGYHHSEVLLCKPTPLPESQISDS